MTRTARMAPLPQGISFFSMSFEIDPGDKQVSRPLAAAHIVALHPRYMRQHAAPQVPTDLATLDGMPCGRRARGAFGSGSCAMYLGRK